MMPSMIRVVVIGRLMKSEEIFIGLLARVAAAAGFVGRSRLHADLAARHQPDLPVGHYGISRCYPVPDHRLAACRARHGDGPQFGGLVRLHDEDVLSLLSG